MQEKTLTMMDAIFPRATLARDALLILGFCAVTALCAQIAFYIGPVPITGQTFAVLLAGALLGSKRGAISQLTYLGVGAMGAPVFAGWHGGPAVLLGPTGGYLIGFVAAAFVVGFLAERGWDRRFWSMALAMLIGNIVIYAFGLPWLAFWLDRFATESSVLSVGLYPFIPGDLFKLVLAAVALPSGWAMVNRLGR
ncbi:MAG: biotin transporter BioY [Dehalococcoidia bacterium]|nr:biotin transporter BioY [Dehalococcoidia bacterium]